MKKVLFILCCAVIFSACSNDKKEEKARLDEVIKMHDQVMGQDEHAVQNKMKLDTLLARSGGNDTLKISTQRTALIDADKRMEQWMGSFDPSTNGKSHKQVMDYLDDQKNRLKAIEDAFTPALQQSDDFLKQNKKS